MLRKLEAPAYSFLQDLPKFVPDQTRTCVAQLSAQCRGKVRGQASERICGGCKHAQVYEDCVKGISIGKYGRELQRYKKKTNF